MVSLGGFGQPFEVGSQLGPRAPRSAIDALQHLALLVTPPVRARYTHQLEVAKASGVGHVRTAAQVHELVGVAVGGDHPAGGTRSRVVGFAVEDLDLVGMLSEQLIGRGTVHLGADERLAGRHDGAHLGLDRLEVVIGERPRPAGLVGPQVEVVIEAVSDRRSDRERGARVDPQYRLGQHMRSRMAQHLKSLVRRREHQ